MEKDTNKQEHKKSLEVRVLDWESIKEFPELEEIYGQALKGYYTSGVLVVMHNGKVVFDAGDGFEPEDATFERDLYWVPYIIQKAYEMGFEDGKAAGKTSS